MKIIWDTFIKWGLVGDQTLVLTHVGPSVHYLGATCGLDIRLHRALLAKWPCPKPLWAPPELSFVFEHSSTPQKKNWFPSALASAFKVFLSLIYESSTETLHWRWEPWEKWAILRSRGWIPLFSFVWSVLVVLYVHVRQNIWLTWSNHLYHLWRTDAHSESRTVLHI